MQIDKNWLFVMKWKPVKIFQRRLNFIISHNIDTDLTVPNHADSDNTEFW
jgi:hypothetical protein